MDKSWIVLLQMLGVKFTQLFMVNMIETFDLHLSYFIYIQIYYSG